jgi:hypothetical protein
MDGFAALVELAGKHGATAARSVGVRGRAPLRGRIGRHERYKNTGHHDRPGRYRVPGHAGIHCLRG